MLEKLSFAISHYGTLTLFVAACWGWGQTATRWLRRASPTDRWLSHALSTTLGMGFFVMAFQILAIGGWLRPAPIVFLVLLGITLALVSWLRESKAPRVDRYTSWQERFGQVLPPLVVALAVGSTLLAPLGPTGSGDDAMYHLPHARQWAQLGSLQVNDWLRYPWFPYNIDLLYAAALTLQDDVLTHLLHALAGWLTTLIIYRLGVRYVGSLTAALAALFWLTLTSAEYGNAYIDMGVTLFVLAGCVCLQHWREQPAERRWLAMSAFFIGVAAGSKYQVLALLPLFLLSVLWKDRRPSTLLLGALALALPCLYWYARNAIQTGDPFNPLGGRIFGFSDWDAGDLAYQFYDIQQHAGWPAPMIWVALAAPLIPAFRRIPAVWAAMVFSAFAVTGWLVSSHFPRYLMPAYPLLALLAAAVWTWPIAVLSGRAQKVRTDTPSRSRIGTNVGTGLALLALVIVGRASVQQLTKDWGQFAGNSIEREALLRERVAGYGAFEYLKQHPARKIYQLGLEASLYYAPQRLYGDHFGRWRYRDFYLLPPKELAAKLSSLGFDAVIVHTDNVAPFNRQPDFNRYFSEVLIDRNVRLYRINIQH